MKFAAEETHAARGMMSLHQVFDVLVESGIPLFELSATIAGKPDFHLRLAQLESFPQGQISWLPQAEQPDGYAWISCGKIAGLHVIRFAEIADFLVSVERREIVCYPQPEIPVETLRHLFLDQVLPRLLAGRDQIVLHAGAVVIGGEAVGFLGESGSGKSTLCVSLANLGNPLITDDSLLLRRLEGRIVCIPSYPGVRLWPESVSALFTESAEVAPVAHYMNKYRLSADRNPFSFAAEPFPLRKIYLIEPFDDGAPSKEVSIAPLTASRVFKPLLDSAYRLDVHNRTGLTDEFNLLAEIAAGVPFARLCYPRDFSLLPQIHQVIYADLN